ncbi:MAG: carboxypeptidase regulatory-like domain-containing protein, partial [Planctomycetota bacterium]
FAHKAWRASICRAEREQHVARHEGSMQSPAEILEAEDQRRRLIELVLALEEPLRVVLMLRFFEQLPPREVAGRLGLPLETVRTRQKRGLELLRARLDRESHGDRGAWALALVRALKVSASGPQAVALLATSVAGVLVMPLGKKVALAFALLVLIGGGAYLRVHRERVEHAVPKSDSELVTSRAEERTSAEAPAAIGVRSEVLTAAAPSMDFVPLEPGSVLLQVSWHDGNPARDIGATFHPIGPGYKADAIDVRTGADGSVRIDRMAPGQVEVWLDRGVSARGAIDPGGLLVLALTIPLGCDVNGLVVESDGRPVAGAEIFANHRNWTGHVVARSDEEGRFHVRSLAEKSCCLSARQAMHPPTPQQRLEGGSGYTYQVRLVFAGTGGALEGTVWDDAGLPIARAQILAGGEDQFLHGFKLAEGGDAYPAASQLVRSDEQGRYEVRGLPAGRQVVKVLTRGHARWMGEVEIVEGRTSRLDAVLVAGTTVTGTVTNASGHAVAGVEVALRRETGLLSAACRTDAEGRYELTDLPSGALSLHALWSDQVCAEKELRGSPGAVLRWDPVVDGGLRIRGRVVVPGVDPLPSFRITAEYESLSSGWTTDEGVAVPMGLMDAVHTDESGRFEFVKCNRAPHLLRIAAAEQSFFDLASVAGVLPGADELVIEIDPARLPSVRLSGRVVDDQGHPVAFAVIGPQNDEALTLPMLKARADGTFDLGTFPPGRWRILAGRYLMSQASTEFVEVATGQTHDFGDLVVK